MATDSTHAPEDTSLLLLFDGHALIYRAYHAFPGLTDSTGMLVNAVYGFTRLLLTAIRDFEPEYLAICFDHPEKTKRHSDYEEYKAHREKMPDDLIPQIAIIKEIVTTLNIPQFELAGYEADDLIGTITKKIETDCPAVRPTVVTGDKDILQLVTDTTSVFIPGRGKYSKDVTYTPDAVLKKMGVPPRGVIDLKALMGDASDNIPGVKGVGKKTAENLLGEFKTLAGVYKALSLYVGDESLRLIDLEEKDPGFASDKLSDQQTKLFKPKLTERLQNDRENARLSYDLATIWRDVDISFDLSKCVLNDYDRDAVQAMLKKYDFKTLIPLLPLDTFESSVQDALF